MRVGVFGAGTVGGYLGTRLSAAGVPVVLVGRGDILETGADLRAVPLEGAASNLGPDAVVTDDPTELKDVSICLVTVKSQDTETAAKTLAGIVSSETLVISFQNGLHNAETLRRELHCPVVQGVISYNMRWRNQHEIHQATSGKLYAGDLVGPHGALLEDLVEAFSRVGEKLELRDDIAGVAAGKLLLNLNNGVCAATGLSILESLESSEGRECFSRCILEGIDVMRANGIEPRSVIALPPGAIARVLRGPDFLVVPGLKAMAGVDPDARSSTLQDLDRGRSTEIGELNGAIVELASEASMPAPCNRAVVEAVREHEARIGRGEEPDFVAPRELLERMDAG